MQTRNNFFMPGQEPRGLIVDEPKRTSVCCKMEMSLFRMLAAAAKKKGITLSEEIRERLREGDGNGEQQRC